MSVTVKASSTPSSGDSEAKSAHSGRSAVSYAAVADYMKAHPEELQKALPEVAWLGRKEASPCHKRGEGRANAIAEAADRVVSRPAATLMLEFRYQRLEGWVSVVNPRSSLAPMAAPISALHAWRIVAWPTTR